MATYTNSKLISGKMLSPNYYNGRVCIDRIIPHCYVGWVTAERACRGFANPKAYASASYNIGYDGEIWLCVEEKNAPWTTSSYVADTHAITFEIASRNYHPYEISDAAMQACIDLIVDICQRYGKTHITWIADKAKNLAYKPAADEILLSCHRFYAAKACPGDYIFQREAYIAEQVNARLQAVPWGVDDYVGGLYKYALTRTEDEAGYKNWCDRLMFGGKTAAEVAWGFFGSAEYKKKKTPDERYVQQLYEALLRREPDKTGKRNRLKELANGESRQQVCSHITNSREFTGFCKRRDIKCR